ncbi:MAG: DHA2 family efflux MFS transporter permease subunit [Actinomycetes bacterium]
MTTPDATTVPGYERRWLVLVVLSFSLFMVVVDNTIVNVALPTLSRELSATTSQLQWIVDAYSLVFAGLLLACGSVGDRYGRKGALIGGLLLFGVTSVIASFTTTADSLIAARAAMGIGAALVFPATLAILTNVFVDPVERTRAIGIWAAVSGLAVALGPVSGGWLLEHFWWGSIFLVNVPIVLIAAGLAHLIIPKTRDPDAGRFDPVGVLTSIAAVVVLVFTVIEAPKHGWTSARTLGGFTAALVLLIGFVGWEMRRDHPMLDVRVFRNARFSSASASIAAAFFCLFGFIFLLTQYFQFVRGYSTLSAGLHTLPFAAAAAVGGPLAAFLTVRFGTKLAVTLGLTLIALGLAWASTLQADTPYWGPVVLQMLCIGAGLTLTSAPATEAILGSLPKEKAGVGSAVNDTTRELGGTIGVAVVGSVFASLYGPDLVRRLAGLPIPQDALAAARESVQAAALVARQAPAAGRPLILQAASDAFMHGLGSALLVGAGVAIVAAVAAVAFLPARAVTPDHPNIPDDLEELAHHQPGEDRP